MSGVNWEALTRKPDKVLRPWMADDEMDAILDAAYQELVQGFKRTAPMGKGGPYGISPLDRQPAVLREIEELIRHPERFRGDDDDPSGKPTKRSKKPQKGTKKGGASAQAPGARGSDGVGSTKDLLAKANYFVSSALDAKKVAARRRRCVGRCVPPCYATATTCSPCPLFSLLFVQHGQGVLHAGQHQVRPRAPQGATAFLSLPSFARPPCLTTFPRAPYRARPFST